MRPHPFPSPAWRPEAGRSSRLTIAIGIHQLVPKGGLEDNCLRTAEELRRRGHRVILYVAGRFPGGLPFPVQPIAGGSSEVFNHRRAARFAKAFAAATASGFDRTLTFQPVPGADLLFCADWLRDRPDMPLVRRLTPRFRTYAALERGCFAPGKKTRIIGLAEPQMQAYRDRYGTEAWRVAIVPPTVAPSKKLPEHRTEETRARVRAGYGIGAQSPVWLWLGLQPAVKGLDRVVAALQRSPDAHLFVGGLAASDPKLRRCRAEAARRGVAARVHFPGFLSGARLNDHVAAADVLSHPARLDVTGGVILEAIVNGLPVVATGICGFAEHIERSGAGTVLPEPFDPGRFDEALSDACGPRNAAYSAKGIAYGKSPALYSGIAAACDLIEMPAWAH